VEPLVHFVVPLAALLLFGVELKKALSVSLFALLPDVDALFLVHRSLSHSIVVMLIVVAPFLVLIYKFKPRLQVYGLLGLLATVSHSVLDVFNGFTPILWPLYNYSVWIQAGLGVHIGSSPSVMSSARLLFEPVRFESFQGLDAPLFTGEGLILSLVLLSPVLLRAGRVVWRRIKGNWSFMLN